MDVGDTLKNLDTGEARFRVKRLLVAGRSFYIAEGEDIHLDDLPVILKAIRYPEDPTPELVKERREALHLEVEALTCPSILLPEPIDFFDVQADVGVGDSREPVLVLEFHNGKTLREEMEKSPRGMPPRRALKIIHEIALSLEELHERGFAFRDLNPDHVIVGLDDIIHLVGTGNIARLEARPHRAKLGVSAVWSAPEIREEVSGKFITREADIYSLGALLSCTLTGVEPSPRPESPLPPESYERLMALPEGYGLLVTRCMQAMAKRRFKSVAALLPFLNDQNLPTPVSRGFAKLEPPVPFSFEGLPDLKNRALRSKLSGGPLISVARDEGPPPTPAEPSKKPDSGQDLPVKTTQMAPWWKSCLPWLTVSLGGLVLGGAWALDALLSAG